MARKRTKLASPPIQEKATWVGSRSRRLNPVLAPKKERARVWGTEIVRAGVIQAGTSTLTIVAAQTTTRTTLARVIVDKPLRLPVRYAIAHDGGRAECDKSGVMLAEEMG
jgi:hypothetical protein